MGAESCVLRRLPDAAMLQPCMNGTVRCSVDRPGERRVAAPNGNDNAVRRSIRSLDSGGDAAWTDSPAVACAAKSGSWLRGSRTGSAFVTVSTAASIMAPFFSASAVFPQDAVTIDGETRDYAGRFFCPGCGSSVFARTADEIEVNLGSLDAPDQLMPTYESWIVRRESWLPPFPLDETIRPRP